MVVINTVLTLAILGLCIGALKFRPKKVWEYVLAMSAALLLCTNIITIAINIGTDESVVDSPLEIYILTDDCREQLRSLSDILVTLRQNADYLFPGNIIAIQEYLFGFVSNSSSDNFKPEIHSIAVPGLEMNLVKNLYFQYRDYDEDDDSIEYLMETEYELYIEKLRNINLSADSVEISYEGYELEIMRTYVTNRDIERYYCAYDFLHYEIMTADDITVIYYVYKNTYHMAVVVFEIDNTGAITCISLLT